ncbi:MAG: hypothetical protein DELT_02313 [Desulfovibrio sp.]
MTFEPLRTSPLFMEINDENVHALLRCLKAVKRTFCKDELVYTPGSKVAAVGIVLSGGVRVLLEDFAGQRTILAHAGPGELFGESFSCIENDVLPISVAASHPSEIMLIDYRKLMTTCSSSCAFHTRMIMNMVRILAKSNILLTRKIEHISKRTTREKLLSFLSAQAVLAKSHEVEVPFNRQELADYLCVDRSALSRELGAMQADGLIRYDKQRFELLRPESWR